MRCLLVALLALSVVAGPARSDDVTTTIGDIPRTYSHYLNAQEAALCRADAAAGGIAAYFLNPANASRVEGVAGQATARYNVKSRDYLPDGVESFEATDDGFMFTQVVAVKRSGSLIFGFGYSNPSYRSLEITGTRYARDEFESFEAEFRGGLRTFEVLAAARIGSRSQGGVGVAAGLVNLNEEAVDRVPGVSLDTAKLDGMSGSLAVGFTFDATDVLTFGIGYRLGLTVQVDGEWYKQQKTGESKTQPVTVAGIRLRATDNITVYGSYIREGWDRTESTLAAYPAEEGGLDWKQFTNPISTAALGAEVDFAERRFSVRAGWSKELGADIENAIVPENAFGLGGVMRFSQYAAEVAVVREQFLEGGESAQVTNYGIYATVSYEF
jgi:hypothetical protein